MALWPCTHWQHSGCFTLVALQPSTHWQHSSCFTLVTLWPSIHWQHSDCFTLVALQPSTHWQHSGHLLLHTDSTPAVYSLVTLWLLTDGQYLLAVPLANYLLACHDWYTYNSTEHSISSLQPAQWQYHPLFP